MIKNAKEIRSKRAALKNDGEIRKEWEYIEEVVNNFVITKDSVFIPLRNIKEIHTENLVKLSKLGYYVAKDRDYNCSLYFDKDDFQRKMDQPIKKSISEYNDKNTVKESVYENKKEIYDSLCKKDKDFINETKKDFTNNRNKMLENYFRN